ncbi:MAG: hypothetical protein IJS56_01475 [Bacilli bacterium]|nr:hypothetical protein [Bacilli bacterium]
MKIINKRKIKGSLIGLSLLALVGCTKINPDTDIPKSIDALNIEEVNDEEVVKFNDLEDINVYFEYRVTDKNIIYGSSVLKEVDGDNYKAYYNYKSGNLVGVEFDNLSEADKFFYRNYLNTSFIKVSTLEEQLTNPNNIKLIQDGINFDEEYINLDTLRLMDASMYPHNKEVFTNELDKVCEEKKLTR